MKLPSIRASRGKLSSILQLYTLTKKKKKAASKTVKVEQTKTTVAKLL